jgi:FtsP/CotA-like multicopper oxidase with cupredoxin domain
VPNVPCTANVAAIIMILPMTGPSLMPKGPRWARFGSGRARFTPTEAGDYHFFCHVDGHAKKGMTGTLVVEP